MESGVLPQIPVTSIGYRDAIKIFQNMDGDIVPWSRWRGGMQVEYRHESNVQFRLNVRNRLRRRRIKNFVAFWYGREERDKWILAGIYFRLFFQNHGYDFGLLKLLSKPGAYICSLQKSCLILFKPVMHY